MTPEERIEQLERIISHLLDHAPMPTGPKFRMTYADERISKDAAAIRSRAWESTMLIYEAAEPKRTMPAKD